MIKQILTVFICLLFIVNFAQSQSMQIIPNAGISKPLGDGSEYWKLGYNVGINIFSKSSSNISFGGRIAYNRIPPNGDELIKFGSDIPVGPYSDSYDYKLESTSGAMSIIEIIPSILISTSKDPDSQTTFDIIAGLGLYSMSSNVKVKGTYESTYVQSTLEIEPESESTSKFGLQLGFLLTVSKVFTIQPHYNIIFTEEESTKYFTVNIGYKITK